MAKAIQNYLAFDFQEDRLFLSRYDVKAYSVDIQLFDDYLSDNRSTISLYYGYSDKLLNPAMRQQGHSAGIQLNLGLFFLPIFLDYEIGLYKYSENIPGWYANNIWNDGIVSWDDKILHRISVGMKYNNMILGLYIDFGYYAPQFGLVMSLAVGAPNEFNVGLSIGDNMEAALRFRRFHERLYE